MKTASQLRWALDTVLTSASVSTDAAKPPPSQQPRPLQTHSSWETSGHATTHTAATPHQWGQRQKRERESEGENKERKRGRREAVDPSIEQQRAAGIKICFGSVTMAIDCCGRLLSPDPQCETIIQELTMGGQCFQSYHSTRRSEAHPLHIHPLLRNRHQLTSKAEGSNSHGWVRPTQQNPLM